MLSGSSNNLVLVRKSIRSRPSGERFKQLEKLDPKLIESKQIVQKGFHLFCDFNASTRQNYPNLQNNKKVAMLQLAL